MKTQNVIRFLVAFAAITLFTIENGHAQTTWVPLVTSGSLNVSYQPGCMNSDAVLLRMENTGTIPVTVTWSLWPGLPVHKIELMEGEIREGLCMASDLLIDFIPAGSSLSNMSPSFIIE